MQPDGLRFESGPKQRVFSRLLDVKAIDHAEGLLLQ
jgi:hypothetical protein